MVTISYICSAVIRLGRASGVNRESFKLLSCSEGLTSGSAAFVSAECLKQKFSMIQIELLI